MRLSRASSRGAGPESGSRVILGVMQRTAKSRFRIHGIDGVNVGVFR